MTRGQRLAVTLFAAAALLLVGRGFALVYVDRSWYLALSADFVWRSKVLNTLLLYGTAIVVGGLFALGNMMAVRRSVVSLVVPAQVGNVEIGEEIPPARLTLIAASVSAGAVAVSLFALPSWTTLALWRSHVHCNETDPYFGLDLAYYVAWLPLELGAHVWAFTLFAIVALLVVILYALTPSLGWTRGTLHVTTYARRHLTVLAGLLLLLMAWEARLDAYGTLIHGNGPDGLFTHIDHQWVVPATLLLSIVLIGAAVALTAAGWVGQMRTALATVTVVMLCAIGVKVVLPWISGRAASSAAVSALDTPYVATRRLYTARAFPTEPVPASARFAADPGLLSQASQFRVRGRGMDLPTVVYPGARGFVVESDPQGVIHAPRVGDRFNRIMHAWAEQNPQLLHAAVEPSYALIRRRDVRDRVTAVAPIFTQSHAIGVRPTAIGLMWIVDLYTTSEFYPLSASTQLGGQRLTYRHHAATAYVNAATAEVTIVPDSGMDPIASAWWSSQPGEYLAPGLPAQLFESSQPANTESNVSGATVPAGTSDSSFHARVKYLYTRMRTALDSGDFHAFGDAFDSLGTTLGVR